MKKKITKPTKNSKRNFRGRFSDNSLMLTQPYNRLQEKLKSYTNKLEDEIIKQEVAKNELRLARKIQEDYLPIIGKEFNTDKFSVYANLKPAKEVSGDFYDVFFISKNIIAFIAADVSGKGFPAAFFMAIAKTTINNVCKAGFNVTLDLLYGFNRASEILYLVNNALAANNMSNMFVTAFFGLYDIDSGRLCYSNAGHPSPIKIHHNSGKIEEIPSFQNPVLGVFDDIEFLQGEIFVEPDESVIVYTDGIIEAVNNELIEYGDDRLKVFLVEHKEMNNIDLTNALINDVEKFQNYKLFDDATILSIHRKK